MYMRPPPSPPGRTPQRTACRYCVLQHMLVRRASPRRGQRLPLGTHRSSGGAQLSPVANRATGKRLSDWGECERGKSSGSVVGHVIGGSGTPSGGQARGAEAQQELSALLAQMRQALKQQARLAALQPALPSVEHEQLPLPQMQPSAQERPTFHMPAAAQPPEASHHACPSGLQLPLPLRQPAGSPPATHGMLDCNNSSSSSTSRAPARPPPDPTDNSLARGPCHAHLPPEAFLLDHSTHDGTYPSVFGAGAAALVDTLVQSQEGFAPPVRASFHPTPAQPVPASRSQPLLTGAHASHSHSKRAAAAAAAHHHGEAARRSAPLFLHGGASRHASLDFDAEARFLDSFGVSVRLSEQLPQRRTREDDPSPGK